MKKHVLTTLILALSLIFLMVACNTVDKEGLWEGATYRRDVELGKGEKTVYLDVEVGDDSVRFTVHTDKEMLGDALLEHSVIAGEEGPYGLYVKQVNGITADYDKDGHYWSLEQDGEPLPVGVDSVAVTDGAVYSFVYV